MRIRRGRAPDGIAVIALGALLALLGGCVAGEFPGGRNVAEWIWHAGLVITGAPVVSGRRGASCPAEDVIESPGQGIRGRVDGHDVTVGGRGAKHPGVPLDMEFAIGDGRIWPTQTRPIRATRRYVNLWEPDRAAAAADLSRRR